MIGPSVEFEKYSKDLRVAIVHDWLVTYAGAERVLEQVLEIFPNADIFSLVDFLPKDKRAFLSGKVVNTSFIQGLPFAKSKYRNYLPLMPLAIEQLDLGCYDLIISSSYAVAKGVLTGPDQLHVSYVHSPIRYAWDLQHQYLKESGLESGVSGFIAKSILHYIRLWDSRTSNGVDKFVANSGFIARRIRKVYGRSASIVYPPVDVNGFAFTEEKSDFYLTAGRMVPYKRTDLLVEAFSQVPQKKLIVIGDGPDFEKVKKKAGENVILMGHQPFEVLRDHMQKARAFIFAAEEDFGITPVEAQACGTPVVAFGRGGALETIRGIGTGRPTGVFFEEQSINGLIEAIECFEENASVITAENCRNNSLRFSEERFRKEFKDLVDHEVRLHRSRVALGRC